jgi:hypothetical protein
MLASDTEIILLNMIIDVKYQIEIQRNPIAVQAPISGSALL